MYYLKYGKILFYYNNFNLINENEAMSIMSCVDYIVLIG